ncbi:carbamoyltransferase HypF [Candidatus Thorarchaeota archaeon]|nr:MAG: carbamoyltransferase HypF [Candidatus Thorarchaeota archaeon]
MRFHKLSVRAKIHINGIVQGVGFRPFVYRVAKGLSLKGYVLNLGDAGVEIVVEGKKTRIKSLLNELKENPPSISRIEQLDTEWLPKQNSFDDFSIIKSSAKKTGNAEPVIPPDISICDTCVEELFDPQSRWYLYPFISCAACGPRYSTITDLPYDRPHTTMVDFPLCNTCNTGYTDPLDRRYHAQTTACEECGPTYQLFNDRGNNIAKENAVKSAAELIESGSIVAVQGISGTHLATAVRNSRPINRLRLLKMREQRPFAIMARNKSIVESAFNPSENELDDLLSWRRPIVLVRKRESQNALNIIPRDSLDSIAPGLDTVGVMLPYAPSHHLLFHYMDEPAIVLTSANPTGIPMYIDPKKMRKDLSGIADYFLVHDRRIWQRADDSVIKYVTNENSVFIRRSRGYVPEPIPISYPGDGLNLVATGPEEKATASILKATSIYPTQYIGDTDQLENIQFLRDAYQHLMSLIGVEKLDGIACDLHPEFLSTDLARRISQEKDIPLVQVQHHHAHLASILVDNKLTTDTSIICITADGYGYGPNGEAWGGEVLVGNGRHFSKFGGLTPQLYVGGDLSAKYAARPFMGIVGGSLSREELFGYVRDVEVAADICMNEESFEQMLIALDKNINTIESSSTGRVLDAAAFALGVCFQNSYDGECPMKLEAVAVPTKLSIEPHIVSPNGSPQLDTEHLLLRLLEMKEQGEKRSHLAMAVQQAVGRGLARIAAQAADNHGIRQVGFSGGVALNRIITRAIIAELNRHGLEPLLQDSIPPGDGGISVGQVAVAASRLTR